MAAGGRQDHSAQIAAGGNGKSAAAESQWRMFIGCAYSLLGSGTSEATVIEQKNNCASGKKATGRTVFMGRLQF